MPELPRHTLPHPGGAVVAPGAAGRDGLAVLRWAAWAGSPLAAPAVLDGLDPAAEWPAELRWLAGVCLGALGRYRTAAAWLAPAGEPAGSAAASCLASHLRQLGRHADAEPLDRLALATADTPTARADALTGLVADAVGRHELAAARERLAAAVAALPPGGRPGGDAAWRPAVRVAWVTAEVVLLAGDPEAAVGPARAALRESRAAMAPRHTVKSQLVLGASLYAAGRFRPAARVLRAAETGSTRLGLIPLLVPVCTLRAEILQVRAPSTAARERRRAGSAQSVIEVTPNGATYR